MRPERELSRWPPAPAGLAEPASGASLADVLDRILDKGVVINADIAVSVVGVEVLGVKLRAAIASFETAARYGLEFPSGVDLDAPAWREAGAAGVVKCKEESLDGAGTDWERGRWRRERTGESPAG